MIITIYDQKPNNSKQEMKYYLKIDGKEEILTIFVTDEVKKPDGFLRSGLTFPIHYSESKVAPFLRMIMTLIGARNFKLLDNGKEKIAWFGGFCSG